MKKLKYITGILVLILLYACANRGRPSGGDYDTTPPVIINSEPENFTNNFNISELNIGHSIIARALFVGAEQAVREMKKLILENQE